MFSKSRILTRAMSFLVLLLSPLQVLQGMHGVCAHCSLSSTEEVAEASTFSLQTNCSHSCCCGCKTTENVDWNFRNATELSHFELNEEAPCPCSCPSSCAFCHGTPQPQLPSPQPVEVKLLVADGALAQLSLIPTIVVEPSLTSADAIPCIPLSAQEICVALCRFRA